MCLLDANGLAFEIIPDLGSGAARRGREGLKIRQLFSEVEERGSRNRRALLDREDKFLKILVKSRLS